MDLDDEVCLCFHVTKRKVLSYIRVENVRRPGQLAECFGAGTGCGWCRPYLEHLFRAASGSGDPDAEQLTYEQYSRMRQHYLDSGAGAPSPGPDSPG